MTDYYHTCTGKDAHTTEEKCTGKGTPEATKILPYYRGWSGSNPKLTKLRTSHKIRE